MIFPYYLVYFKAVLGNYESEDDELFPYYLVYFKAFVHVLF